RLLSGVTESSVYDAQDRITSRGGTSYAFGPAGYLTARGGDSFTYTAEGELTSATAGGQTVDYAYDANGRRVGRTAGAAHQAYFYGDPRRPFAVTGMRDSAGRLLPFYYDEDGSLYAFDRDGSHFYVGTDQVGTPRVVT